MLDTQTPFPQPRSFCLYVPEGADPAGRPQLAQVQYWLDATGGPADQAVISLPFVEGAASGNRRVDRAELQGGAALPPEDLLELETLGQRQRAFERGSRGPLPKKARARLDRLIDAKVRAVTLAALLEALARRHRQLGRAA